MSNKKIYRSEENKVLGGVFGGLGEYFDVDPTLLRLAYIGLSILSAGFPSIVAYIIAYVVMPAKPKTI